MVRVFIFFFPVLLLGQQKITNKYIDSELLKVAILAREGEYKEYMVANNSLLRYSRKNNYSKGIATACLNLAYGHFYMWNYQKSLEYLRQARDEDYADNLDFQIVIKRFLGLNYSNLGFYNEAITEFKEIAVLSDKISEEASKTYFKSSAYGDIGEVYQHMNKLDSSRLYLKMGIGVLYNEKKLSSNLKALLVWQSMGLAEIDIAEKKIDLAAIQLGSLEDDAQKLLGNNNFRLYKIKGLISEYEKEYGQATVNFEKALQLAEKAGNIKQVEWLYNAASKAYKKDGNNIAAEKYFYRYTALHDKLKVAKFYAPESIAKELISMKEDQIKNKNKIPFFFICSGVVIIIVFIIVMIKRIRRKNKVLNDKEYETQLLNEKLGTALEKVVQLAKNNDPEFLTRFQEVYPEFFPALVEIEPKLLNTELKFCALLFLGFSTKEIAASTFVQSQSVQTRKNRLRKKLNIASDENIYSWMKNLNTNNL